MNDKISDMLKNIDKTEKMPYVLLSYDENNMFVLSHSEQKYQFRQTIKRLGGKFIKNSRKSEQFLYGMDVFDDFYYEGFIITITFQLACKSTMHGAWIPLDKTIGEYALENRVIDTKSGLYRLEDRRCLVYKLAKCVFTDKIFSQAAKREIQDYEALISDNQLVLFLEKVFFKFTPTLIKMLKNRDFDNIISSCYRFSDY
jgi:hypothetical protein